MFSKKFFVQPYGFELTVWLGTDLYLLHKKVFGRHAKAEFLDNSAWTDLNGMTGVVLLNKNATAGQVAHESEHIKNHILAVIGHKGDYENDEVDAYLIHHIVDMITEAINESKGQTSEIIQPLQGRAD